MALFDITSTGTSWRTTIGGVLAGVPPIIVSALAAANIPQGRWVIFALTLSTGLGILILGTSAKDKQVHSTEAQVVASTVKQAADVAAEKPIAVSVVEVPDKIPVPSTEVKPKP